MPTKIGGGGRPQEYDPSNGRYGRGSSATYVQFCSPFSTTVQSRRDKLDQLAKESNDPLLFDIYESIQQWRPNYVVNVNRKFSFPAIGRGEIDIETKKHIIEIKSGNARRHTKQYRKELKYAQAVKKQFIIYSPEMKYGTKVNLIKHGFVVISTKQELQTIIMKGAKK